MPNGHNTMHDALWEQQIERNKFHNNAINYIHEHIDLNFNNIKGDPAILRRKELTLDMSRRGSNSCTHAELAEYDADYSGSLLINIIHHIYEMLGKTAFHDMLSANLETDRMARKLFDWWIDHKDKKTKDLRDDLASTQRRIDEHNHELKHLRARRTNLKAQIAKIKV